MNNPPESCHHILSTLFWFDFSNYSHFHLNQASVLSEINLKHSWMAVGQTSRTGWKHLKNSNLMVSFWPNTSSVVLNTLRIFLSATHNISGEWSLLCGSYEISSNCSPPQPLDSLAGPVLAHQLSVFLKPKAKKEIQHLIDICQADTNMTTNQC